VQADAGVTAATPGGGGPFAKIRTELLLIFSQEILGTESL
jgi:hypothetical protein